MPKVTFKAQAHSENPTKTVVRTNGFTVIVDEPKNQGGTNEGPTPVDYVLAALAGCLNVVGHVVAKELGMNLNGVKIDLEGDLNPAKFMGMSDAERAGYQSIRVTLRPDTDADAATKEKWRLAVESRCPVSDNLSHETPVSVQLG
ncbi:MAG: OsmC family protein [Eubacteriales bacterium]|nr:OsmC family protein [Eubacteriales bacterium]MDD3867387.1 OsmC family protein [Eubacteriales bacterium]MDD4461916.1 OsmC family protein [Eubacteriales bacterium]